MNPKTPGKPLSESEELLLVKFIDNECGFLDKIFAKRLIKNNLQAAEFVHSLNTLSDEFSSTEFSTGEYALKDMSLNLWDKISQRIDQEEKAEFYLGGRTSISVEKSAKYDWAKLNWGLSSGLAVAGLAIFFIYSGFSTNSGLIGSPISGTEHSMGSSAITLVSSQARTKPDWIKSHGQVRMIKDSGANLPIIWVNRNIPSYNNNRSRAIKAPSHTLFDLEDNRTNTPVILEDKVPNALSVSEMRSFKSKQ